MRQQTAAMAHSLAHCSSVAMLMLFLLLVPAQCQQGQLALSREPDADTGVVPRDDEAAQGRAVRRAVATQILRPYEQCGGEKGLCNSTTIGVPCGDAPWGVDCPAGHSCQRKTAALWQCYPVAGKNSSVAGPGSEADAATQQVLVPVGNGTADFGNGQKATATNDTEPTPEVRSCPPGAISVGSRCFKSSAGSRKGVAGTLAASAALLAVWQLAVVLVTALLVC